MEDKHNSSDKQTKNNEPANDVTKHTTPSETPHDIDETTAREDEYKEFNKNTVNPTPQTTGK